MPRTAYPPNVLRASVLGCAIALGGLGAANAAEGPLWIEGESARRREVVANPGLEAVVPDELSGGAWVASFANQGQATGSLTCEASIPADGSYRIWVRGTGDLACRVGDGAWITAGKPVDTMSISLDGNPGWPTAAWHDLGTVELPAGSQAFTWRLGGEIGERRFGALDCFVLATGEFKPQGKWKPGEAPAPTPAFAPGSTWDFDPGKDAFDPAALLDLRSLNEQVAGETGFVRASADGEDFVRGDGQPLRLWAAGLRTSFADPKLPEMRRTARFLAKRGINVVRIFAMLTPDKAGTAATEVNERELDCVFRLVAALKQEGIYSIIDGYWGSHAKPQKGWDIVDSANGSMTGLVFFDPKTQAAYRAWMSALLTRPNPHTGLRLADDPSLAILQLQNEDHLLWYTFNNIKGDALLLLRRLYGEHLVRKYGSLAKAREAWKGHEAGFPADDLAVALPGFMHVWDLTNAAWAKKSTMPGFIERTADQLEFVCNLTRAFNLDTITWLRKDLGLKCLVNANNWQTVDMTAVMDAQNWADSDAEVMGLNFYTGGPHFGVNNGWQILAGHRYGDLSCALRPQGLPSNVKQLRGKSFILPEALWTPPNLYQSEAALMTAGQQGLVGLDAACWFCNYPEEWSAGPQSKWTYSTPMQLGQFPAAALIQRHGYVRQGAPVIVEHRSRDDLWRRTTPLISQGAGWDPNRQTGIERPDGSKAAVHDALAYMVGPVQLVPDSDAARSEVKDLARYIDRDAKLVRSNTGEIETDFGRGVYRINTPCAQAAAGFLGQAGPQRLAEVEIACRTPYAAIAAVSLDGLPLKDSRRVLVQVGTLARPTGWSTVPARFMFEQQWVEGSRIVSVGKLPWQVQNIDAEVAIANPGLVTATALDGNGMPLVQPVELRQENGRALLKLPNGTLHLILAGAAARQPAPATKNGQP